MRPRLSSQANKRNVCLSLCDGCRLVKDGDVRRAEGGVSSEFRCVSEVGARSRSPAWVSCSGCLGVIRGEVVATSGEERFLGSPSSPLADSRTFWMFPSFSTNKFTLASFDLGSLLLRFSSGVVVGGCSWGREEMM